MLNDSLRNKVIDVKGRTIFVKDVAMKSLGDRRVEIRIDFAGSKEGTRLSTGHTNARYRETNTHHPGRFLHD